MCGAVCRCCECNTGLCLCVCVCVFSCKSFIIYSVSVNFTFELSAFELICTFKKTYISKSYIVYIVFPYKDNSFLCHGFLPFFIPSLVRQNLTKSLKRE